MAWGGSGAASLGLAGPVGTAQYEAVFGPGGPRDPVSGERLVPPNDPVWSWWYRRTSRWPS